MKIAKGILPILTRTCHALRGVCSTRCAVADSRLAPSAKITASKQFKKREDVDTLKSRKFHTSYSYMWVAEREA